MPTRPHISRREFCQSVSAAAASVAVFKGAIANAASESPKPLSQFNYGDVDLTSEPHEQQLDETRRLLMGLDEDSLLKPLRQMSGMPAPGEDLGGWYHYNPDYVWGKDRDGFAPSCTFGQWVSALARMYAIRKDPAIRDRVLRLNRLYAQTISDNYYEVNRFPTYCYDKIVCGLIDSHQFAEDPDAFSILERTTDTALAHFPPRAIEHDQPWRPNKDQTWTWDESYTISENLFLAYQRGAGERYRELGKKYLDDAYYSPLAEGRHVLAGRHAYSYVNSLSAAMQAYLTLGSETHLQAAKNAFDMLAAQSFATGGWGPRETLCGPSGEELFDSLADCHASFETPCGAYAHFKLTRYLLRVTRNARYGDSMERVMYNTVLGAKPLMPDGRTFYYSDYSFKAHKVYSDEQHWSCCSGTLPQVAADYRINTYFHDPQGVWVNLYLPSTLRWNQDSAAVVLSQEGHYPFDNAVRFKLEMKSASNFVLNFRIPAWATGASLSVNGRRWSAPATPGTFASVSREWTSGDTVELELPISLRTEPIDPQQVQTVALCFGPLVLFAITDEQPSLSHEDLLAAKRIGQRTWLIEAGTASVKLIPFTEIRDEQYSTYLRIT
jgi:uncharacterized protein